MSQQPESPRFDSRKEEEPPRFDAHSKESRYTHQSWVNREEESFEHSESTAGSGQTGRAEHTEQAEEARYTSGSTHQSEERYGTSVQGLVDLLQRIYRVIGPSFEQLWQIPYSPLYVVGGAFLLTFLSSFRASHGFFAHFVGLALFVQGFLSCGIEFLFTWGVVELWGLLAAVRRDGRRSRLMAACWLLVNRLISLLLPGGFISFVVGGLVLLLLLSLDWSILQRLSGGHRPTVERMAKRDATVLFAIYFSIGFLQWLVAGLFSWLALSFLGAMWWW